MRNVHITLADAIRGIANVVRMRGAANVATTSGGGVGCVYAETDHYGSLVPVCIVGQFIANLGFLGALVVRHNESHGVENLDACVVGGQTWTMLGEYGITADEDAQVFLRAAQTAQDGGDDWGTALIKAYTDVDSGVRSALDWSVRDAVSQALTGHMVEASLFI